MKDNNTIIRLRFVLYIFVIAVFSLHFASLRMSRPQYKLASVGQIALSQSVAPYQYRSLLPVLAKEMHILVPLSWGIKTLEGYRYGFEIVFTFGLFVVFLLYMRSLSYSLLACVLGLFLMSHALIVTYLIPREYPFYFIYDIPGLFFFTGGLLLIQKKNWVLFYLLYPFAVWNRETICFLAIIFIFVNKNVLPNRKIVIHVLTQASIWLAVKGSLMIAYSESVSSLAHGNSWMLNIKNFSTITFYGAMLSSVGYLWIPVLLLWQNVQNVVVRKSLSVVLPFCAAMFIVGNYVEIRIFGELIPLFVVAVVDIVINSEKLRKASYPNC